MPEAPMPRPGSAPRPYRRARLLGAAVLVLAVLVVCLWKGPASALAGGLTPFELERRPDGTWPEIPTVGEGVSLSLSVLTSETQTNDRTMMGTSSTPGARFAGSSFLVCAPAEDVLAEHVALRVLDGLRAHPYARRIAFTTVGAARQARPGGLAPDVVVRIGAPRLEADTIAGNGTARAAVRAHASRDFDTPRHGYGEAQTWKRTVDFDLRVDVDTVIDSSGFATPNASLQRAAAELAAPIVKALREKLGELYATHGGLPELPVEFWPEFRPVDAGALPLAAVEGLEVVASWRGLLRHNETWWRGTVRSPAAEAMQVLATQLGAAGFAIRHEDESQVRARQGNRDLVVFVREDPRPPRVGLELARAAEPSEVEAEPGTTSVVVCYRERVADEALARAVDATLTDEAPLELLTLYEPAWDETQRARARRILDARELFRADDLLIRARLRARAGNREAAGEDLARAWWQASADFDGREQAKRVEKAAEELAIDLPAPAPTAAELEAAGLRRIPGDGAALEWEVTAERPLRAFEATDDGIAFVTVGLRRGEGGAWQGVHRVARAGASSTTSSAGVGVQHIVSFLEHPLSLEYLDSPADGVVEVRLSRRR